MMFSWQQVLTRFLVTSWHGINGEYFQGRLQPPVFSISNSEKQLGSWVKDTRTISISGDFMLLRGEIEIIDVLKHEMAHQYADEILGADHETPHGSGFRHACRLLGIHHAARMAVKADPSPVMERIRKLLALAESKNVHEAEVAMSKARQLMEKYELDVGEREEPFYYQYVGEPRKQKSAVAQFIAGTLSRFFHVQVVWIPTTLLATERKVWLLELSGTQTNLEIAAYVHDYLERELHWLWLNHKRRRPWLKGKTPKREYQLGVMKGFMDKLREDQERADTATGHELILLKRERLERFMRERHPYLRGGGRLKYRRSETFNAGFEQGRSLRVDKGVKKGDGKERGIAGHKRLGSGGS
jgi:hypothetical protein